MRKICLHATCAFLLFILFHWSDFVISVMVNSSVGALILLISCSFRENLAKIVCWRPPPPGQLAFYPPPPPGEILDLPLFMVQRIVST